MGKPRGFIPEWPMIANVSVATGVPGEKAAVYDRAKLTTHNFTVLQFYSQPTPRINLNTIKIVPVKARTLHFTTHMCVP